MTRKEGEWDGYVTTTVVTGELVIGVAGGCVCEIEVPGGHRHPHMCRRRSTSYLRFHDDPRAWSLVANVGIARMSLKEISVQQGRFRE